MAELKSKPQRPTPEKAPQKTKKSESKKRKSSKITPFNIPEIRDFESAWQPYDLDHYAQYLAIQGRDREVLNESHKMRMTVAYGLERFWGEPFRLEEKEGQKAAYWRAVWKTVAAILNKAGITLPDGENSSQDIQKIADEIWDGTQQEKDEKRDILGDREVALMVLTQFCDCLVWWAQRYK